MAVVFGFKTVSNQNPGASTQTLSVQCTAGTDAGLFVVVTMSNSVNFVSATYDGVAMQLIGNRSYGSLSIRQVGFYLANPTTGSAKNFVVNFTAAQWQSTSIIAQSFTGVTQSALTNEASTGLLATNNSQSITINADDIIYISGGSTQGMAWPYVIAGISEPLDLNQHNVSGKIVGGAFSVTGLSAGATNIQTRSNSGTITNHRWAIGASGGGGGGGSRRIIIV